MKRVAMQRHGMSLCFHVLVCWLMSSSYSDADGAVYSLFASAFVLVSLSCRPQQSRFFHLASRRRGLQMRQDSNFNEERYYNYFAIGSNMLPDTMTALRRLQPLSSTAAVLPNYTLAFDIPGNPWIEPSAASVQKHESHDGNTNKHDISLVHGVVYQLTDADFAQLGRSEGVPFAYQWERCAVIPYTGNGESAGRQAYEEWLEAFEAKNESAARADTSIQAFVLTASKLSSRTALSPRVNIPPSQSYLQVLRDGAAYWHMDQSYQQALATVPTAQNVPGILGWILQRAVTQRRRSQTQQS